MSGTHSARITHKLNGSCSWTEHLSHLAEWPNMRWTNWKTVSTLATLGLLAGCQEPLSAPGRASVGPAPIMLAPADAPSLGLSGGNQSNTSADFTVGAWGGVFFAGNHAVVIPAQGICDPATSTYGPGTWDDPCSPLRGSLKIHAEVRAENGRTWVDFTPSIRFVPSSNPRDWAWIYMYTPTARGASDLSAFNILYATRIGGPTTDDAVGDQTLRTYVDTQSGVSMRRIKHFSGYTVSAGRSCDPATETCTDSTGGGQ